MPPFAMVRIRPTTVENAPKSRQLARKRLRRAVPDQDAMSSASLESECSGTSPGEIRHVRPVRYRPRLTEQAGGQW